MMVVLLFREEIECVQFGPRCALQRFMQEITPLDQGAKIFDGKPGRAMQKVAVVATTGIFKPRGIAHDVALKRAGKVRVDKLHMFGVGIGVRFAAGIRDRSKIGRLLVPQKGLEMGVGGDKLMQFFCRKPALAIAQDGQRTKDNDAILGVGQ